MYLEIRYVILLDKKKKGGKSKKTFAQFGHVYKKWKVINICKRYIH